MKLSLLVAALATFLLYACGGSSSNNGGVTGTYHLVLFSTPNCQACETVLPDTDKGVNTQLSTDKRSHLDVTGYIVTAADGFNPPDQATADAYKVKLNLSFPVLADPWRWTNYSKYYGSDQLVVPGAVVIDPTGKVMAFDSGFTADRVLAYLQAVL